MAIDWDLAERVRKTLGRRRGVTEKRMFGGLCFLIDGNMLCAVDQGVMLFRVGKEQHTAALKRPGARAVYMKGRPMRGFVWVSAKGYAGRGLKGWIAFADRHVKTLPPKVKKKTKGPRNFSPLR